MNPQERFQRRGAGFVSEKGTPTTRVDVSYQRYEGEVRRVPSARLLWKKAEEDGTFTEKWMYLAQSIDDLVAIKRRILSGTDIPANKPVSPDGNQSFVMEQFGDIVFLTVTGLKA